MYPTLEKMNPSSKLIILVITHAYLLAGMFWIDDLDYRAKIALFAFLSAMILWMVTKIPAGYVAISLLAFIILMNAADPSLLYHSLAEEVVWLMIGAFIIGEVVKTSGLAERLTFTLLNKAKKKETILHGLHVILFATVFFIPSTSGRAALTMPVIDHLSNRFTRKEQKFLALAAPTIILISTSATLIGAGSHLIGIGLLESTTGKSISFFQWFVWGLPFAVLMTLITIVVLNKLFWPKQHETVQQDKDIPKSVVSMKLNRMEKKTLVLIAFLIAGWVTESVHGYDIAFITMIGAIIAMLPNHGIIRWKQGIKAVSWNLIVFVAAATALGKVLVDTGVIAWLEAEVFHLLHLFADAPEWLLVFMICLVTVTSHLFITSHTTRAIVFIPGLLLFSETIGLDPATVVFLSLIGMNYCVTFPVSSKALLLFYEEGTVSYDAKNLLKLSTILMPLYIIVMMVFYFTYWQWTGLTLK